MMSKFLSEEQVSEAAEDLSRLVDETTNQRLAGNSIL
jgi:hypothetical protein